MYDVCVVGGGLGGLALAVGLEQLGLDWQLCESAEELRLVSSLPPPPPRAPAGIPTTKRSQCALPACLQDCNWHTYWTGRQWAVRSGGDITPHHPANQVSDTPVHWSLPPHASAVHSSSAVLLHLLCNREVAQLSLRSESHVRPQDPSSPAAEVKQTDLVAPLYTLRWAAMQNILSDLVRTDRRRVLPGSNRRARHFPRPFGLDALVGCTEDRGSNGSEAPICFCLPWLNGMLQVNHKRVRCGHKCTGWSQQEGAEYITCHFKNKPDIK